jgi:hypothetical protein
VLVVRSASSAEFRGRAPLFVGLAAVLAAARPNGSLTSVLQSRPGSFVDVRDRPLRLRLPGHLHRQQPPSSVDVHRLGYTVGYTRVRRTNRLAGGPAMGLTRPGVATDHRTP